MAAGDTGSYFDGCQGQGEKREPQRGHGPRTQPDLPLERVTEVAALLYTLLEPARLGQVDPAAHLSLAATRAISGSGTVTFP